jgi:hypothetical protein
MEGEVKRKLLNRVIAVRLSDDRWEELRKEADWLGIGPTTLVRMWITERLREGKDAHREN